MLPPELQGLSLVALGGGSGLSVLLRGLKHEVGHAIRDLTAIVSVADDGGSSGRLREAFGAIPPGDIRNCLVALADDEALLAQLFQYRFPGGEGLSGHSFGNLFLTALHDITGDFYQAISTAEQILSVRGHILPASIADVRLRGAGLSGKVYEGESAVGSSGERLHRLTLEPPDPPAFPQAVEALEKADLILLGPGSLYTSVLPNLLIPGIREAVRRSPARVVLVLNLMTQPGETDEMSASDHIGALEQHLGPELVSCVLANASRPGQALLERYAAAGSRPVVFPPGTSRHGTVEVVACDLLLAGEKVRHDPRKLCRRVLAMARPPVPAQACPPPVEFH